MKPQSSSITFVTDRLAEARDFYERVFDAKASFDAGWYVVLNLGGSKGDTEVCFMEPQDGSTVYAGGTMLNLSFDDVDNVHSKIEGLDVQMVMPLENHPWGDRGFGFLDPLGTLVYCLTPIEIADEFQQYVRSLP